MPRHILVSNRLSTSVSHGSDGFVFTPSVGGLATGLSSLHESSDSLWVGWSGLAEEDTDGAGAEYVRRTLRDKYKSVAVPLDKEDLDLFYYGFCNNIIWPLFHYFPTYVEYDPALWERYRSVNEKYFEYLKPHIGDEDVIWVHDYHLMLLPNLIREHFPRTSIGYFLHIPFPSYEIFRLLPWREHLLRGLLGSDLVGFHTFDYARHFLSSTRRILGLDHDLGQIKRRNHMTRVDVFPMGIDYEKYSGAAQMPDVQEQLDIVSKELGDKKTILSVDRLDYSKGIVQRLKGYKAFLEENGDYRGKVSLVMIVAPSRTQVRQYQDLKREVEELVSEVNGTFGTIGWTPIQYFFRSFGFVELTAMYVRSDVLLVTALRDGMNLIAKEYIAAKVNAPGVVVLSETAGAARELSEALIVNPTDTADVAHQIKRALEMPVEQQIANNQRMHERLKRYDVHYWAHDFLEKLHGVSETQRSYLAKKLKGSRLEHLIDTYRASSSRLIILGFDGTLIASEYEDQKVEIGQEIYDVLDDLTAKPHSATEVVVISRRSRDELGNALGHLGVSLVADNGAWFREKNKGWDRAESIADDWKELVRPIIEVYVDRTPGSLLQEREYALLWNFNRCEPELARVRLSELRDAVMSMTANHDLSVREGNRVLEIRNSTVNKGRAAAYFAAKRDWEFVLAIGDDWTDEDMFASLPEDAHTVKVGVEMSNASWFLESVAGVQDLVRRLAKS